MVEIKKHIPFVSAETNMAEFTIRALIIGMVLAVVLGSANAYLGLKAGMTIASTYPAAVIGMALLKIMKGTILEENLTRTVGSIGGSIAAGAVFTLPAFYIAGIWTKFDTVGHYLIATAIMFCGGLLGIMFVALLRRVMVEDAELPFPESVAASEIHKAGSRGGSGAKYLFTALGVGALIQVLGQLKFFAASWVRFIDFAKTTVNLKTAGSASAQGGMVLSTPAVSPAYIGVGYIIGPKLASLSFSGGLLAWGLFVPMLLYFLAPQLITQWQVAHPAQVPAASDWIIWSTMIWKFIVRPIAIGGMLVSSAYTLFKMRKSLFAGLSRSISDIKKSVISTAAVNRVEQDIHIKWILLGVTFCAVMTFFIYHYFAQNVMAALVATVVMIVSGFFLAAISGYLCGIVGSSNNPTSGLTISSMVIAALLMVTLGMKGQHGVAAVLGVAAVACVSIAVSNEMIQDLKAGHILGGTPWRMQVGDIFGIAAASAVMFLPLLLLHQGDINAGRMAVPAYDGGFGSMKLSAPQAGLMAFLAEGIVGGQMAWPLIIVGMLMALGLILMQVRSPIIVSIGMYLPLETTSAIFIGGCIRGGVDFLSDRRKLSDDQKSKVVNKGVLIAAGLIAGESLIGLVFAGFTFFNVKLFAIFTSPSFLVSLGVLALIAFYLIIIPLKNAGSPD